MDCATALELKRLVRLEERAQKYRDIGRLRGDWRRMRRAAQLETAAHSRANLISMRSVKPYREQGPLSLDSPAALRSI